MKKALLVVSFGTRVAKAREDICAVENALISAALEYDFYRAFTSPTIRRALEKSGESVWSLEKALENLLYADYTEILVQPTHLLYGYEYDKIKAIADHFAPYFARLAFGKPLLAGSDDLQTLADCVKTVYLPAQPDSALVLLGHGTAHFSNMVYPAMQTALGLNNAPNAFVGTIEGWPGFDEVLAQLKAGNYRHVEIAPLMLAAGDHACNDMAGEDPQSWKSRLEAAGFTVSCTMHGLGILPDVQALYARHLREML